MLKKFIHIILLILLFSLVISSFFPQELAHKYFFQALWFKVLWFIIAIVVVISTVNLLKRKDFSFVLICLGLFLVVLGGFLTSLFGEEGFVEIREGQTVNGFWIEEDLFRPVEFLISLEDFSVEFYPEEIKGMRFVKSYKTSVSISKDGDLLKEGVIEVNKPLSLAGFSFYQYGYDPDLPDRTVLQVVKDPGLPFVYFGYFFLLTGMIFSFRRIFITV